MPPFGKETSEPDDKKPLPFLSLSNAPPSKSQKASRAFAAEGSEPGDLRPPRVVKREPNVGKNKDVKVFRPFQDEEEDDQPPKKIKRSVSSVSGPFADELGEGDCDSNPSGDDETDVFECSSSSVFSLGWQSMLQFKHSNFWTRNQDDQTGAPRKRAYDNSKRSQTAVYLNRDKAGVYKSHGSDPERLDSIMQQQCKCAQDAPTVNVCLFMFVPSKNNIYIYTHNVFIYKNNSID